MAAQRARKQKAVVDVDDDNPFVLRSRADEPGDPDVHVYGRKVVCATDTRGQPRARGRSPLEIVVDATEGFIPLWSRNTTLRWRFNKRSMRIFQSPAAAAGIERLMAQALTKWGDAVPVKFAKRDDAWDFEVVMRRTDDCDSSGCVLAMAFFPDAGRHQLVLYPKLFEQSRKEQIDTLVHEFGHVFGLRHFFAVVEEREWASEIFGKHRAFSIMNYGSKSVLTGDDRADLKRLYKLAWSGDLTNINGTPIRFVKPFHIAANA